MALEEKYIKVPKHSSGRRAAEEWEETPKRKYPSRQAVRPRRSTGVAVAIGLYKFFVVICALIVAGYIAFRIIGSRAPEMAEPPVVSRPATNSTGVGVTGDGSQTGQTQTLERRDNVYNILLAATDWGGTRTDVMMVMSYDIEQQKVGVVSVPRDTITRRESGVNPKLVYGPGGVEQRMEDISAMLGYSC